MDRSRAGGRDKFRTRPIHAYHPSGRRRRMPPEADAMAHRDLGPRASDGAVGPSTMDWPQEIETISPWELQLRGRQRSIRLRSSRVRASVAVPLASLGLDTPTSAWSSYPSCRRRGYSYSLAPKLGMQIHSGQTNQPFEIAFPRGSARSPRGNSGYDTWTWFFFLLCHREVGNALRSNEGLGGWGGLMMRESSDRELLLTRVVFYHIACDARVLPDATMVRSRIVADRSVDRSAR